MKNLIAAITVGMLLVVAAPVRAAEGMMDDPQKMEMMKKSMAEMDKAMAMMKKAMAKKDEAMARESAAMMKKALVDWNKAYPMQGL